MSCWLDLHTEPARGSEQWPRCSLVVLEQESGRCNWSRITRHRGAHAIITHTHSEVTAEAQRLADRMRTRPDAGTAAVREMADRMRGWTQRAHRQVKAEQTLIRAGQPCGPKQEARRSVAVLLP